MRRPGGIGTGVQPGRSGPRPPPGTARDEATLAQMTSMARNEQAARAEPRVNTAPPRKPLVTASQEKPMSMRSIESALLVLFLCVVGSAGSAAAQATLSGEASGIWIADDEGQLQRVQPAFGSFLRQQDASGDVRLVLSVESFAGSANGALSAGSLAVTRVLQAIAAAGVPGGAVESELAYLEPRFEYRILAGSWEKPRRTGFDAAHLVTVETANTAALGRVIDSAIGAGATRVLSVGPTSRR